MGSWSQAREQFSTCNAIVIAADGDAKGRYEVWCRRCKSSLYTTSLELAIQEQAGHRYTPYMEPPPQPPAELAKDWSESLGQATRLDPDIEDGDWRG